MAAGVGVSLLLLVLLGATYWLVRRQLRATERSRQHSKYVKRHARGIIPRRQFCRIANKSDHQRDLDHHKQSDDRSR